MFAHQKIMIAVLVTPAQLIPIVGVIVRLILFVPVVVAGFVKEIYVKIPKDAAAMFLGLFVLVYQVILAELKHALS
jgi:hypothetical protein